MINDLKKVISRYYEVESAWLSSEKNTDAYLAAVCLVEYPSYRLKESDQQDILIGFRAFSRTIRRIFKKPSGLKKLDDNGNSVIVSGGIAVNDIINYITRSGKASVHTYIERDTMSLSAGSKLGLLFALFAFGLRQSIKSISSPYRRNIALSITEVVEIAFLINFLRKHNIKIVYDFLPYEVDSNFMYLLLKEEGIHVIKVPSSGPLATHHKILISDDVVFSTPYHYEEFQKFKNTFRIKHQLLWPPERAHQYYAKYSQNKPIPLRKTLGFYSHGEWLRKEEKHSAYGGRIGDAEETILKFMGRFVIENPDFTITIFPHPRENRKDVVARRDEFYTRIIGHDNYNISPFTGGTSQNFDKCDIALAAFSTILYERLFCGYKTLIGNMYIYEFPMNKSALNNVCFKSYEEMSSMIKRFAENDEQYYFESTQLSTYQLEHYPEP
jgi:hypothetical protein